MTPAALAVFKGHIGIAKHIQKAGGYCAYIINGEGHTLWHLAASMNDGQLIKNCIDSRVPINVKDGCGYTAAYYLAQHHPQSVTIARGKVLDLDKALTSDLFNTVIKNDINGLNNLLKVVKVSSIRNAQGYSLLDAALILERPIIVDSLRKQGAKTKLFQRGLVYSKNEFLNNLDNSQACTYHIDVRNTKNNIQVCLKHLDNTGKLISTMDISPWANNPSANMQGKWKAVTKGDQCFILLSRDEMAKEPDLFCEVSSNGSLKLQYANLPGTTLQLSTEGEFVFDSIAAVTNLTIQAKEIYFSENSKSFNGHTLTLEANTVDLQGNHSFVETIIKSANNFKQSGELVSELFNLKAESALMFGQIMAPNKAIIDLNFRFECENNIVLDKSGDNKAPLIDISRNGQNAVQKDELNLYGASKLENSGSIIGKHLMFKQNRKKRILKNKNKLNNLVKFFVFFPYQIAKYITNEIVSLIFDLINLSIYLAVNTYYLLNLSYQKIKTGLTLFINWAMKFRAVQLAVNFVKATAWAVQSFLSATSIKLKTFVVNHVPIRGFVLIARVLPIGDWLKYEDDPDTIDSSMIDIIRNKDLYLLEGLLQVCSEEALHKYLLRCGYTGPIQHAAFFHDDDTTILKKIIEAIKPEKRLWILTQLSDDGDPFVCSLVRGLYARKRSEVVMNALPQKDKIHFMNQVDKDHDSPIMLQAMGGESWKDIKTFINHYPKEHLLDYLNIKNNKGRTFLVFAALHPKTDYLEELFKFIPEQARQAYFAKHHQGLKALLYAKAYEGCGHQIEILERQGLKLPPELDCLSQKELYKNLIAILEQLEGIEGHPEPEEDGKSRVSEWVVRENFKKKHGQCPLEVLKLDKPDPDLSEIKSAYKKLMLFSHPDKNNGSKEATEKSTLINEAYAVYTKSDIRKKYY